MTVATLNDLLPAAADSDYAIAGLVVLGWEDARAYVEAAERLNAPIILQAGPGCRRHTPLPLLGKMFRYLAENASVPVVCHVDHATTIEECRNGIDHGFTSVMYDGSNQPIGQNIETTRRVVEVAHAVGVSVEGEVGVVGYADGAPSMSTSAAEAARFEIETGVDALAVSVGNVHLQRSRKGKIDFEALRAIEAVTSAPLVLHGASGIPIQMRRRLAAETRVAKFNIGTELRMAYGKALRDLLTRDDDIFDQIAIANGIGPSLTAACSQAILSLRNQNIHQP